MLLLIYGLALGTGWPFEQVGLNANLGALLIGMVLAGDGRSTARYDRLWTLQEAGLTVSFLPIAQAGLELAQAALS